MQTVNFTLTLTVNSLLTVTTTTLPVANVNKAYSFQMTVTGGVAPYTWSATGLPAGLTLSSTGLLSGTPTVSGSSTVNFTVSDSGS